MPSASKSIASAGIRRRRVTTACVTCRDRRVSNKPSYERTTSQDPSSSSRFERLGHGLTSRKIKCDRVHPVCTQCTKGIKKCKYVDQPKFEFVGDARSDSHGASPSGTWDSVIDSQVDFIKKTEENGTNDDPVWALAEAAEAARPHEVLGIPAHRLHIIIPISDLGDNFVSALTHHFPSRDVCQPLFESFLLGIHPIIPVCHVPTLYQQYEEFWNALSPSYAVESLALILVVLYTGAANTASLDTFSLSTILRLFEDVFDKLDFGFYQPKNTTVSIQLLQGYVIMSTFKASQLSPFSAYGFLPQAIRFVQTLRLHTETKQGDPAEIETRKRLWWHLLSLDIESTVATGLPTIIHRSGYTTQLPAFRHQSVAAIDVLQSGQSELCPMVVAMHGNYQWAHRMQSWIASLPSRDEVSNFKTVIENLVALIPDDTHSDKEWARLYLNMQIDRAYCMLGLRFWQLDQYKETECHSEVVQTARSFLANYLRLSTLSATTHFSWFVPGLVQPIHAIIILLMHLSTCRKISEEETSRSLLDRIMTLRVNRIWKGSVVPTKALLQGHCHSQRSNPRYLVMVELRKRVWRKVDWDADGKGMDPWAGKEVQKEEAVRNDDDEVVPATQPENDTSGSSQVPNYDPALLGHLNTGWDANESTGLERLDSILAGDPMDLFQWDEWESLASDFFANPS